MRFIIGFNNWDEDDSIVAQLPFTKLETSEEWREYVAHIDTLEDLKTLQDELNRLMDRKVGNTYSMVIEMGDNIDIGWIYFDDKV